MGIHTIIKHSIWAAIIAPFLCLAVSWALVIAINRGINIENAELGVYRSLTPENEIFHGTEMSTRHVTSLALQKLTGDAQSVNSDRPQFPDSQAWNLALEQHKRISENPNTKPFNSLKLIAAGWPLESLARFSTATGGLEDDYFAFKSPILDITGSRIKLPLRPLPLGFAINTLFYAALILIPWELAGWGVRARRRRRALCPRCAHSLAGLPAHAPCPECGTAPKGGVETPQASPRSETDPNEPQDEPPT
ncbi:MAG: hypothetical protein ACF8Q5_06585 [Phycisphaerales bacterium JB040]